ncbi:MAG TPA: hypothetical protein VEW42_02010 [Candidatus Eisenbacteria bacterium]|nr:hypothetical protein [Candidatus Eisenbacteria bacterium]
MVEEGPQLDSTDQKILHLMKKGWTQKRIGDELGYTRTGISWRVIEMRKRGVKFPDISEWKSYTSRKSWKKPQIREKRVTGMREAAKRPGAKEKKGEVLRRRYANETPQQREERIEKQKRSQPTRRK